MTRCGLDAAAAARAPAASLEELGMDSLALLELSAVVADRWRVHIPEQAGQLSIGGVADLVAAAGRPGTPRTASSSPPRCRWSGRSPTTWRAGPNLFTEYAVVEILHRDGNTVRFRLTMPPTRTAWRGAGSANAPPTRPTCEVRARRVETGPFEYMRIRWCYDDGPEGTRMTWVQDFAMKPTAPVDDAAMTARINTNSRVQTAVIEERIERAYAGGRR